MCLALSRHFKFSSSTRRFSVSPFHRAASSGWESTSPSEVRSRRGKWDELWLGGCCWKKGRRHSLSSEPTCTLGEAGQLPGRAQAKHLSGGCLPHQASNRRASCLVLERTLKGQAPSLGLCPLHLVISQSPVREETPWRRKKDARRLGHACLNQAPRWGYRTQSTKGHAGEQVSLASGLISA